MVRAWEDFSDKGLKSKVLTLAVVAHVFDPGIREAVTGESL